MHKNPSHLEVNIYFIVEDDNHGQRQDVLDSAGEQSVPDPVMGVERVSVVPILRKNLWFDIIGEKNLLIYTNHFCSFFKSLNINICIFTSIQIKTFEKFPISTSKLVP